MTRLRPAALLLLAALPGAAWAACNPVGTEDCCTKVVTEECISADWPRPSGIVISMTASDDYCFFLGGMPDGSQYHGIRHETWIPVEPRITCPPDRNDPFDKPIRTFVSWEMTTNEIVVATGNGKEAIVPEGVTGYVRCVYTIRSFADSCSEDVYACDNTAYIGEDPTPQLSLVTPEIIPRYSDDPPLRPTETCQLSLDSVYTVPITVQLTCTRVRFEDTQNQSLSHTFSPGETTFSFIVSGQVPSETMDDGYITATVQPELGGDSATKNVTVVWVEPISMRDSGVPTPPPENMFSYDYRPRCLGPANVTSYPNPEHYFLQTAHGVEFKGLVHPSNFEGSLYFTRDCVDCWFWMEDFVGSSYSIDGYPTNNIPRGKNDGTNSGNDDPDPSCQSPFVSPTGYIYDVDIPGTSFTYMTNLMHAAGLTEATFYLERNFVQYVIYDDKRVSNDFRWNVKLTRDCFVSSAGTILVSLSGDDDDNSADEGWLKGMSGE